MTTPAHRPLGHYADPEPPRDPPDSERRPGRHEPVDDIDDGAAGVSHG